MMSPTQFILSLHAALLRMYPRAFRTEFGEEMRTVFACTLADVADGGVVPLIGVCLRELKDWPESLLLEHWHDIRNRARETTSRQCEQGSITPGLLPVRNASASKRTLPVTVKNPLIKRLFDLAFAIFWLVVTAPLLLVIAILIKLDSPGPIFFQQQRVGRNGRLYTMYKFRSMFCGAGRMEAAPREVNGSGGLAPTANRDPRVTRVGVFIRRLNLDELPQLANVVAGKLTVFGPPPRLPR